MIVVDTSALISIVLDEPPASRLTAVLEQESHKLLISAATMAELLIVAAGRKVLTDLHLILDRLEFEVVPVTETVARNVGEIYLRWGKGFHPAGLNFGDCFAYELAKERACPLLFVGNDFSRTDITAALTDENRS